MRLYTVDGRLVLPGGGKSLALELLCERGDTAIGVTRFTGGGDGYLANKQFVRTSPEGIVFKYLTAPVCSACSLSYAVEIMCADTNQ